MTGRLNIAASILAEHRLHVHRCTCRAWEADLTLDARSVRIEEQHRLHVAAALDAALAAQEGERGGADAVIVPRRLLRGLLDETDYEKSNALHGEAQALLADPAGALAKHDAEVRARTLREAEQALLLVAEENYEGSVDLDGDVYQAAARIVADRIAGDQP